MASIYTASEESIDFLGKQLLKGEIVAVPTETVYGLAANAYDGAACSRIFQAKNRPVFDPLIVHVPLGFDLSQVTEPSDLLAPLIAAFWPGPLSIVLTKKPVIPDIVTAGLDSIAVRMPRHTIFQKLLTACQVPLAAPSANPFGYVSPTTCGHVAASLGDKIPFILDGGPCEIGIESTILDIRNPKCPLLLRPGAVSREELSEVLHLPVRDPSPNGDSGIMPGQLKKHYSPSSACHLREKLDADEAARHPESAWLFYQKPVFPRPLPNNVFWLTDTRSDTEAARRLFGVLRRIDEIGFAAVVAERAPKEGLGRAINDRLTRAAAG